jgi:hypothetical protein
MSEHMHICANLELLDDELPADALNEFMHALEALMCRYGVIAVHARPCTPVEQTEGQEWH